MNRAAIFFDRDNTLIVNDGYLGDPAGVVLIAGAAKAISRLRAKGYAIVTMSNQSGVARGMFPEEAVHAVNARMDEMLRDDDPAAIIDRHEFCPYHADATVARYKQDSELRKPKPGMIYQAAKRLSLNPSASWVIGDAPRDIAAGRAAGCRTILFRDPSLKSSAAAQEAIEIEPDFTAGSLEEAVDIVERNTLSEPEPQAINEPEPEAFSEPEPQTSSKPEPQALSNAEPEALAEASMTPSEYDPTARANDPPAAPQESRQTAPAQKMTFAERVRAGTFQPARVGVAPGVVVAERPKRESSAVSAKNEYPAAPAADPVPEIHPTEPVDPSELIEPLLEQILEEVRLMRHQNHRGNEFSVTKLLAGIVQVLVLPVLFFAYLHHETPVELQSMLLLATFLQTLTIALLIMGRQH